MHKFIFILFTLLLSCSSNKNNTKQFDNQQQIIDTLQKMKFATYSDMWQQIKNFEKRGLTKSAYEFSQKIYQKAKKENNSPQIIKTLLYQSKYIIRLEEDSQLKIVELFKKEINESSPPTNSILENYLAQLYWQYYKNNRWRFAHRTETNEKINPQDFRTWDLKTIFREINLHFDKSLQNKIILQNLQVKAWEPLLEIHKENRKYRPTLYDLLLHEALQFYQSNENTLNNPAYKFTINDSVFFSDVKKITKIKIKDSLSLQAKALKLYQELLDFHLLNNNIDALAMADLERINFIYKQATFLNKGKIYRKTLSHFIKKYDKSDVSALAYYYWAQELEKQGNKYNISHNKNLQWKKKEALELAKKAIEKYPNTIGSFHCKQLIKKIQAKKLSLQIEENTLENKPALIKISFKNMDKALLFIYKADIKTIEKLNKINEQLKKQHLIEQLPLVKKQSFSLPNIHDYQPHNTEKILEALPNGNYVIVLKSLQNDQWNFTRWQVTDIALQVISQEKKENIYTIINRKNGKAIPNAHIKIYTTDYYQNNWIFKTQKNSNEKGEFYLSIPKKYYKKYYFIITYDKNKKAFFYDYITPIYPTHLPQDYHTAFIFTDRSIYRPGQTIYFKAIALTKQANHSKVLANTHLKVTLYDVNQQKIKELNLITNEYGSISGNFLLPAKTLTGNFKLIISNKNKNIYQQKQIKVEEYKRPKFEVDFKKIDKTYKVNETVSITGFAKSFAGTNITNAKVSYRVKRKVQMPHWWYWHQPTFHNKEQEIKHGKLQTNEKGEFIINFKALPDLSITPNQQPIFHYEIFAEVTDINGETHTATTIVKVGYHSLLANIKVPIVIIKGKTDTIYVQTTNLNGVNVPTKGEIKIYKLQAPKRILRRRPWNAPEIQEISKENFIQLFPHIPYDKTESNYHFWPKGKNVFSKNFDTNEKKKIIITAKENWEDGKYFVLLTTHDKNGNLITDKSFFEVKKDHSKNIPDQKYFDFYIPKNSFHPGENVQIFTGSSANDTYIRIWVEKNKQIIKSYLIKTDGKYHIIKIPVSQKDQGGFAIHYSYYAFNYYVTGKTIISIPYPSKKLQIEVLTFRDKLYPGNKEQWHFKIKGPEGEKITAEILASMYDTSLDKFIRHSWHFNPIHYIYYHSNCKISPINSYKNKSLNVLNTNTSNYYPNIHLVFEHLKWFNLNFSNRYYLSNKNFKQLEYHTAPAESITSVNTKETISEKIKESNIIIRGAKNEEKKQPLVIVDGKPAKFNIVNLKNFSDKSILKIQILKGDEATSLYGNKGANGVILITTKKGNGLLKNLQIKARKNLQETAFFFPQLYTDKNGNVNFSFTIPETLTQWKLQLLAHTQDLNSNYKELFAVTQKDLMLFPNAPRFSREGDKLILSTKISNLTSSKLQGIAQIELIDAITQKDISKQLIQNKLQQTFNLDSNGNTQISWIINIPKNLEALQYKVMAKSGQKTDAEQNIIPILSNRILVTETLPIWVRSKQSKTFILKKLLEKNSKTLKNHSFTLEITNNPIWYAVQALPYLMEYPYECSEQTFARYYANTLASHIITHNPKIKEVFDTWKNLNSKSLLSNLEKNQELKSLIIEETPWLRDAKNETEQKKRIALLFELNKMSYEQNIALQKLQQMQLSDGGFSWFKGGRYSNRYITQHIVSGIGHLKHLNVFINDEKTASMLQKAIHYLDKKIVEDYKKLLKQAQKHKNPQKYLDEYHTSNFQVHYLYARSFFKNLKISSETQKVINFYKKQAQKYWLNYPLYTQGLLALVSHRNNNKKIAKNIIYSLNENSIKNEELGMYWKNNTTGWHWHEAPIETQALLIEAFDEIDGDTNKLDEMRIWLLKNKQTNAWKTTKQTTEAIYALLLRGTNWLTTNNNVSIKIGNIKITPTNMHNIKTEAGTGYFKKTWFTNQIKPEMAKVTITQKGENIAWGGLYWQYFESLDNITHAKTPINITKELFIRHFTDTGEKMSKITPNTIIKIGDLIRVHIVIKVDRDMEYIHIKDMHAAGFEPINTLSSYKWQDGLGYYESIRDASTNFFISQLHKGIYVFEYDLRANNAGSYSNGITTLQSMYAPEFSSHSKSIHVNIK